VNIASHDEKAVVVVTLATVGVVSLVHQMYMNKNIQLMSMPRC
jgi:hypothetical protein